jgi:hypothetical protein
MVTADLSRPVIPEWMGLPFKVPMAEQVMEPR